MRLVIIELSRKQNTPNTEVNPSIKQLMKCLFQHGVLQYEKLWKCPVND